MTTTDPKPIVTIEQPDEDNRRFTVLADLRTPHSGYDEDNYEYEEHVKAILSPDVVRRTLWDTESAELVAYAKTEDDAAAIAAAVVKVHGRG